MISKTASLVIAYFLLEIIVLDSLLLVVISTFNVSADFYARLMLLLLSMIQSFNYFGTSEHGWRCLRYRGVHLCLFFLLLATYASLYWLLLRVLGRVFSFGAQCSYSSFTWMRLDTRSMILFLLSKFFVYFIDSLKFFRRLTDFRKFHCELPAEISRWQRNTLLIYFRNVIRALLSIAITFMPRSQTNSSQTSIVLITSQWCLPWDSSSCSFQLFAWLAHHTCCLFMILLRFKLYGGSFLPSNRCQALVISILGWKRQFIGKIVLIIQCIVAHTASCLLFLCYDWESLLLLQLLIAWRGCFIVSAKLLLISLMLLIYDNSSSCWMVDTGWFVVTAVLLSCSSHTATLLVEGKSVELLLGLLGMLLLMCCLRYNYWWVVDRIWSASWWFGIRRGLHYFHTDWWGLEFFTWYCCRLVLILLVGVLIY